MGVEPAGPACAPPPFSRKSWMSFLIQSKKTVAIAMAPPIATSTILTSARYHSPGYRMLRMTMMKGVKPACTSPRLTPLVANIQTPKARRRTSRTYTLWISTVTPAAIVAPAMVPTTIMTEELTVGPIFGRVAMSIVTIIQKSLGNPKARPMARPTADAAPPRGQGGIRRNAGTGP